MLNKHVFALPKKKKKKRMADNVNCIEERPVIFFPYVSQNLILEWTPPLLAAVIHRPDFLL